MHDALLYISLPLLHNYDVKMPNFTFCGEHEHTTMTLFFFSWTSLQSFTTPEKIGNIWWTEQDGIISPIKFEAWNTPFKISDIFVAVALAALLLKLPIIIIKTYHAFHSKRISHRTHFPKCTRQHWDSQCYEIHSESTEEFQLLKISTTKINK